MNNGFLENIDKTWTLFLDRDGVINKRIIGGYVTSESEFDFVSGALESINYFTRIFGRIIVVTNQQGVGKGIMTENQLISVHDYMESEVIKNGGHIDAIYYCTDLEELEDNCRKPSVKMAALAKSYFDEIDFKKSLMVGDSISDLEFGINSGMKTVFITNNTLDKRAIAMADLSASCLEDLKSKIELCIK